nr:hypothetical protein B0A51_16395 [Rachicladosporium sp. CCFEE 5018]
MPRKYHALKVPKPRQDWSKWNLYNISRLSIPQASNRTFFQQKWTAKALARAYHNPYVREGQWTRMFDRRLPAVVPMEFRYLARSDGREEAEGRGRGLQESGEEVDGIEGREGRAGGRRKRQKTPYMHMAFHPLERRLDTAVWRALFASSSKQARQFIVHGWVRVNGKKMTYPGYLLNPGDMFQVEPERVMFATGARKSKSDSPIAQAGAGMEEEEYEDLEEEAEVQESEETNAEAGVATIESVAEGAEGAEGETKPDADAKKALKSLMVRARRILDESKTDLSAKRLQELRAFTKDVRKTLSKHGAGKDDSETLDTIEDLEASLTSITSRIPAEASVASTPTPTTDETPAAANPQAVDPAKEDAYRARKDAELIHQALTRARENPVDVTKPYATPWRPRDYMSAFAFIPRYLEVNQNICSAVYLRHAVARPGLAEVPNPLHPETMGLAFNWYLKRR